MVQLLYSIVVVNLKRDSIESLVVILKAQLPVQTLLASMVINVHSRLWQAWSSFI